MEKRSIDMFIAMNNDKFKQMALFTMKQKLEYVSEDKWNCIQSMEYKNPIIVLILSLFLGTLGLDRIYIGDTMLGLLKLITCGGFGVWTIIDWFLIIDATKDSNFRKVIPFL